MRLRFELIPTNPHREQLIDLYNSIHSLGVLHNDVHPRHICLPSDPGSGPMLIDFEASMILQPGSALLDQETREVMAMLEGLPFV
jgi:hypothetical protein